jgi:hypothetical protein
MHDARRLLRGGAAFNSAHLFDDVGDDRGPVARALLMKQTHCRVPDGLAAAGRPTPIAIGVQNGPYWRAQRPCKMGHRDNHIERQDRRCQALDVGRGNVLCRYCGCRLPRRSLLQREQSSAGLRCQTSEQLQGDASPPVPVARFPNQPDGKGRWIASRRPHRSAQISCRGLNDICCHPQGVGKLHDLDVDVGRPIMQRDQAVDALGPP